jgi:hypothetical protein
MTSRRALLPTARIRTRALLVSHAEELRVHPVITLKCPKRSSVQNAQVSNWPGWPVERRPGSVASGVPPLRALI